MKTIYTTAFLFLTLSFHASAQWLGQWNPLQNMSGTRREHVLLTLHNGKVLAAAGWNGTGNTLTSEINSMAVNGSPDWVLTPGSMNTAHSTAAGIVLPNGKAMVIGGYTGSTNTTVCELFDTVSQAWSDAAPLRNGRSYHTATLLPNGKVLVTGGYNGLVNLDSCELYDPASNTWAKTTNNLTTGRSYHTATLMANGKVLIAGGFNPNAGFQLGSAEIYDPATNSFSAAAPMANTRAWHSASLLADGRVMVSGGEHFNGGSPFAYDGMTSCELYDPVANSWSAAANLPTGLCYNQQFTLTGNRVLVLAGLKNTNYSPSFSYDQGMTYVYDVAANTWAEAPMQTDGRVYFAAAQVNDSSVIVCGGIGVSEAEYFKVTNTTATGKPVLHSVVSVFPNPVSGTSSVELRNVGVANRICLTDSKGQQSYPAFEQKGSSVKVSLEGYSTGMYVVQVESNSELRHGRVVVE